jgi:hypothetical protein
MDKKETIDQIDTFVKRVTVVQGSGENRHAEVVYEKEDDEEGDDDNVTLTRVERSIRHLLKAQVIGAQEAYQRHLKSTEKGGMSWVTEAPGNFWHAGRKAIKEVKKSLPFGTSKSDEDKDEVKV